MVAATAMSGAIGLIVNHFHDRFGWSLGSVSAMSCFAVLYFFFDRFFWKWEWARRVLLVPDFNGTWRCEGKTIRKNGIEVELPWSAIVIIRQSWSRIIIRLQTHQSVSASVAASIYQEPGNGYRLIYYYDNQPGVSENEIARHSGLCRLTFSESVDVATGDYFSDKDRMTVGTMQLRRERTSDAKA